MQRSRVAWRRYGMPSIAAYADASILRIEPACTSRLVTAAHEHGDRDADVDFDSWVAARGPALLRFAYLTLGDAARAEEAVQEALATACGRWGRIMRTDNPDAYVRRMVINADISLWRRFRRRETPVAEVFGADEPVGHDDAQSIGETDAMWALCATLPRRQRAAIVLRYYEGLPDAEIARVLDCAEVTVRTQIHRALASLRERLMSEERSE